MGVPLFCQACKPIVLHAWTEDTFLGMERCCIPCRDLIVRGTASDVEGWGWWRGLPLIADWTADYERRARVS